MCHGIVWYHVLCLHQNTSKSSLVFCLDALTTGDDCLPAIPEVLSIPLAGWCSICKHEQWRRYRQYRRTKRRRQQEHEVVAEADTDGDGVSQIAKKRKQSHGNDSQCMDVDVSPKQGRHHRVMDTCWPDEHEVYTAEYAESTPAEEDQLEPCPPRGRPRHRQSWIPVPKVQSRKSGPASYPETSEDKRPCRRRPRQSFIPVPAGNFQSRQPSGTTQSLKADNNEGNSFVDDFDMFDQETF